MFAFVCNNGKNSLKLWEVTLLNKSFSRFRQLQISSDNKAAEHQNQAKLKSFEFDRVQLLHEESLRNIKEMGMQNDTLAKKLEVAGFTWWIVYMVTIKDFIF